MPGSCAGDAARAPLSPDVGTLRDQNCTRPLNVANPATPSRSRVDRGQPDRTAAARPVRTGRATPPSIRKALRSLHFDLADAPVPELALGEAMDGTDPLLTTSVIRSNTNLLTRITPAVILGNMNARSRILEAAADLLASSDTGDIATRAVCEAAGVQQPVLYRIFGDKDGLLAAATDYVWEQYLGMKRAAPISADPLDDLRSGWDTHTEFALHHQNAYKLLFSPALRSKPEAAEESMRLLREVLDRLARQGRLRVPVEDAARMIMAANSGVALALILRPEMYPDRGLSTSVRDAVHAAVLTHTAAPDAAGQALTSAITTVQAALPELTPDPLHPAEAALLGVWLDRLAR